MDMTLLKQELERDEGRKTKLYKDTVGKVTGGIGHNFDDKGISDAVIDLLFKEDMDDVFADLDRALPWWRQMTDARQRVLANMCFNLGISRLLGFVNTLAAMKQGRYADAADGMLNSKWAAQVGARAQRLAKMMREG